MPPSCTNDQLRAKFRGSSGSPPSPCLASFDRESFPWPSLPVATSTADAASRGERDRAPNDASLTYPAAERLRSTSVSTCHNLASLQVDRSEDKSNRPKNGCGGCDGRSLAERECRKDT